jgi:PAS domain S-box-containing protein
MKKKKKESEQGGGISEDLGDAPAKDEQRFKTLFEMANDIIIYVDCRGKILDVNRKIREVLGYKPEELRGRNFAKLGVFTLKEAPRILKLFKEAVQTGGVRGTEAPDLNITRVVLKHKNGTKVPVEASTAAVRKSGKLEGFLSVVRDITGRKEAEEEMRQMSEAAMQFVDFPPGRDMYDFICEKVKQFIGEGIVGVNSIDQDRDTLKVRKILGIGPVKTKMIEKLLGKEIASLSLFEIFEEAKEALGTGKLTRVEGGLYTVLFHRFPEKICREIERLLGIGDIYSIGLRRKDKLFGSVTILTLENTRLNRNVIETFVSQASVALERREAEEALRDSEEKWRSLTENSPDHIMIVDRDGDIQFINRTLPELTKERVIGTCFYDYALPEYKQRTKECFERVLRTGRPDGFESKYRAPDGELQSFESRVGPVMHSGKVVALTVSSTDVTRRKRAEETLKESEEKHRNLVENSPIGIYRTTPDGRIMMANPALVRMLGYSSLQDLATRNLEKEGFEPTYPRSRFKKLMEEEGEVAGLEAAWVKSDGNIISVRENAKAIRDEKGAILYYEGTAEDITERKRAEEALLVSEEKFSKAFHDSSSLMAITTLKEGRVIDINEAYCRLAGYKREELVGHTTAELDIWADPEQRKAVVRKLQEEGRVRDLEVGIRSKSGDIRTVLFSADTITLNDEPCLINMAIDITERKRAEENLRESEERYRSLFDGSLNPITIYDRDATIVMLNKVGAENLKKPLEEIIGRPLGEFIPETRQKTVERVRQVLETGESLSVEDQVSLPDGKRWFLSTLHPVSKPKGKPDLVQVISYDITERKQAELALRESEERFRRALENIPDVVVIYDRDLRIRYINAATRRVTGRPTSDFIGKREEEIWPPEVYQVYLPTLREAFNTREIRSLETDLSLPATGLRHLIITCVPLTDEEGNIREVLGITHDLTERRQAEEALRLQSEIVANMSEGVYLIRARDGVIAYANRKFEEIFGYGPGEMVGRHVSIVNAPSDKSPEETAKQIMGVMRKLGYWQGEIKNIRKDGTPFWCHASVSMFDHPEHGEVLVAVHTDITERKRAQEELVRLSNAVKMSTDSIVISDLEGRIVDVNDATMKMYGVDDKTELMGKNSFDLIAPEDREHALEGLQEAMKEGYSGSREYSVVAKDGRRVPVETNAAMMKDTTGRAIGFVGISRDISERRQLRQRLIQSEKLAAVGTLAYGIAHEFNNILAGIMVNAEFATSSSDEQEIRECFKSILENTQRGSSITNSLLAVAGERKGKREVADISQTLDNVLSFSRRELEKVNVTLVTDLEPVPEIFCDPGDFSEIFLNIINNARDAMQPEGGTLTVKIGPHNDNIRIVFKDTGCGIPDEVKGRIFDPFVTTKGALGKSEAPGTGLGLYLAYSIVDSYGGRIEVQSEKGKGTTFDILIPVSRNLPAEAPPHKKEEPVKEIEKKLNILLIDDEKTICSILKRFLESKGHRVTASLKAEEGLEHFEKDKFDLVLSDITMPGMDGIELIKEIKKKGTDSKIIAITGHVRQQKLDQARDAGAEEVLIKPFRNAELYETIARLLSDE